MIHFNGRTDYLQLFSERVGTHTADSVLTGQPVRVVCSASSRTEFDL